MIECYKKKEPKSSDAKVVRMELNRVADNRKKNYLTMDSRIEITTETFEKQKIWNGF